MNFKSKVENYKDDLINHGYDDNFHHPHEEHNFLEELMHHLPYAIFSVAMAMIVLSLLDYGAKSQAELGHKNLCYSYHMLFHSFHFLHILFASTGTVVTYSRFSKNKNLLKTLLIGTISPAIFCMLSDVVLPYLSGLALGVSMELHICFHKELSNVLPFLAVGILNGLILKSHHSSMLKLFSLGSHFIHILISSLASLFYLVSHGFNNWYPQMGIVFVFLVLAIVIPCTFSDVIIPMYFAGVKRK